MARKSKLSNEQILEQWLSTAVRGRFGYSDLIEAGWEAGQVGYMEITFNDTGVPYTLNYERFYPESLNGGFIVVEWDNDGNIGVC